MPCHSFHVENKVTSPHTATPPPQLSLNSLAWRTTFDLQQDFWTPDMPPLASIEDLPLELHLEIFKIIQEEDIYSLALCSRVLNRICVPAFLERVNVYDPRTETLTFDPSTARNTRISLSIAIYLAPKRIKCTFNSYDVVDSRYALKEVEALLPLVAAENKHLEEITVNFSTLGYCHMLDVVDNLKIGNSLNYLMKFQELLEAAANKSQTLVVQRDPLFRVIPEASMLTATKLWWSQDDDSPSDSSSKPSIAWCPPLEKPLNAISYQLRRLSRSIGVHPALTSRSLHVDPLSHHNRVASYLLPTSNPRPRSMRTLNVETALLFEHPDMLSWSINILNTTPLVDLSLRFETLPREILNMILPSITIPSLQNLSLACPFTFAQVDEFLACHPGIKNLCLGASVQSHGISPPIAHLLHRSNKYLPKLQTLEASVFHITHILQSHQGISPLDKITATSYIPFSSKFAVDGIQTVLQPLPIGDTPFSLRLDVVSNHASPAFEGSRGVAGTYPLGLSTLVMKLTTPAPEVARGDPLFYLPNWLSSFPPQLEHLTLIGNWFASMEQKEKVKSLRRITEACPKLKTFTANEDSRSVDGWFFGS